MHTTEEQFPKSTARESYERPFPTPDALTGTTDVTGEGGVPASIVTDDGSNAECRPMDSTDTTERAESSALEWGGEFENSPPDMISSRAEGGR